MANKYVVVLNEFEIEVVQVFSDHIQHVEAAFYFHRQHRIVSAGFFGISKVTGEVSCWGHSQSLTRYEKDGKIAFKAESRGEVDAELIREQIFGIDIRHDDTVVHGIRMP